jgi:membrane associated rhomboid family serine protease
LQEPSTSLRRLDLTTIVDAQPLPGRLPQPMIEEGEKSRPLPVPVVTWTILALNVFIFFWDRRGNYNAIPVVFADLIMRPSEVILAAHRGQDHFPLVTLFTSLFLHATLYHLLANLMFLFVFGPQVEQALGSARFAIYYFFWGLVAWGAQIYIDPTSTIPTLGASGAIGGVLGCYFLLFPSHKVDLVLFGLEVSAWIFLGLWFLYQIFVPTEGVANWAHIGGFTAGMATVLIAGGRKKLLQGRTDLEPDYV